MTTGGSPAAEGHACRPSLRGGRVQSGIRSHVDAGARTAGAPARRTFAGSDLQGHQADFIY